MDDSQFHASFVRHHDGLAAFSFHAHASDRAEKGKNNDGSSASNAHCDPDCDRAAAVARRLRRLGGDQRLAASRLIVGGERLRRDGRRRGWPWRLERR